MVFQASSVKSFYIHYIKCNVHKKNAYLPSAIVRRTLLEYRYLTGAIILQKLVLNYALCAILKLKFVYILLLYSSFPGDLALPWATEWRKPWWGSHGYGGWGKAIDRRRDFQCQGCITRLQSARDREKEVIFSLFEGEKGFCFSRKVLCFLTYFLTGSIAGKKFIFCIFHFY